MDEQPHVIEQQIATTRDRLDRDLDSLNAQMSRTRDWAAAQAQWWGGVSAVALGAIGALAFWPRRAR